MPPSEGFVSFIRLDPDNVPSFHDYPFVLPAVQSLKNRLQLDPHMTIFVGENGTGKSTLIESIATVLGFNAEGGTKNFNFATRRSESSLGQCLRVARTHRRPRTGYFLRSESFFNVATNIEVMDAEPLPFAPPVINSYGGRSLHEQSHGESFMALVRHRFGPSGIYILDEPESALSPGSQLELVRLMWSLCRQGSQFIVATHSPILMAYPNAWLYQTSNVGLGRVSLEETSHYRITKDVLERPRARMLELLADFEQG